MNLSVFLQLEWMELSVAAPVGKIDQLAIQRCLPDGKPVVLATCQGVAAADAAYRAIGAFGLTAMMVWFKGLPVPSVLAGVLLWPALWERLLGGVADGLRRRIDGLAERRVLPVAALLLASFATLQWLTLAMTSYPPPWRVTVWQGLVAAWTTANSSCSAGPQAAAS